MEYIGAIIQTETRSFSKTQWIAIADLESNLQRHERIEVRNPATGKLVLAQPPSCSRKLILDEDQIGHFSWSQNDEPVIWIESLPDKTHETICVAKQIAVKLGGNFTTDLQE